MAGWRLLPGLCFFDRAFDGGVVAEAWERISEEQFQAISRAIADPRRFAMLRQIAACGSGLMCGALEMREEISPATISHHLRELQEAGLVVARREGRMMRIQVRREVWGAYLRELGAL